MKCLLLIIGSNIKNDCNYQVFLMVKVFLKIPYLQTGDGIIGGYE